jgi:putative DNA primase/helicase
VLVLEGEQGSKKSSSLYVLGFNGNWAIETSMGTDTKDFFMQFSSKPIIEFSEGETLSRTEVKRMKAIITTQNDKFRAPYDRVSRDHPRRCVFAMTTNLNEYLKDETGNRRWLPVTLVFEEANIEWLENNREQLYAEAYERVIVKKETTWDFPREETRREQDARRISDPNSELVTDWYFNALSEKDREEGITILQVFTSAYNNNMGSKKMQKWEEMSISNILKDVLKLEKKQTRRNGLKAIRWFPKGMEVQDTPDGKTIFTYEQMTKK